MITETWRNATRCNLACGAQHTPKKKNHLTIIIYTTIIPNKYFKNVLLEVIWKLTRLNSGHYIANPNNAFFEGKSLKVIFPFPCLIPPIRVILWPLFNPFLSGRSFTEGKSFCGTQNTAVRVTTAEVHGVQSPGLLRQAGDTHHLSWYGDLKSERKQISTPYRDLLGLTLGLTFLAWFPKPQHSWGRAKMQVLAIPRRSKLCIPPRLAKKLEICPRWACYICAKALICSYLSNFIQG